jgi:hypothetical protein
MRFGRIWRCTGGVLILFGVVEMGRYTVIHMKLDKAANAMGDFVTQGTAVTTALLDSHAAAVPYIIKPFTFSGTIIFTSAVFFVTPLPPCTGTNVPCITWQYRPVGSSPSKIGQPGGNATIPGRYTILPDQNIIVAEVYFRYEPLLDATAQIIPSLRPHDIYKTAVYKPRIGTLTCLSPCPPPTTFDAITPSHNAIPDPGPNP